MDTETIEVTEEAKPDKLDDVEEFTDADDWYLVKADFVVKPFLRLKTGHSPFKVNEYGSSPDSLEFKQEKVVN